MDKFLSRAQEGGAAIPDRSCLAIFRRTPEDGGTKKLIAQIMKFGVVGAIAFVIDYGLLALLTEAFGVNYLVSATVSVTVSVVFNYVASMRQRVQANKEGT